MECGIVGARGGDIRAKVVKGLHGVGFSDVGGAPFTRRGRKSSSGCVEEDGEEDKGGAEGGHAVN